jgi:hypothetical protein
MAGQRNLDLGYLIVEGVKYDWTPSSFDSLSEDQLRMEVYDNIVGEKIVSYIEQPPDDAEAYVHLRKGGTVVVRAEWDGQAFMDVCMRDHLSLLYELQKPVFIQFDDEMSSYCSRLDRYDDNTQVYFTPTYPVYPLGYQPNAGMSVDDWTDCLIANNNFVNEGYSIHSKAGLVVFDTPRNPDDNVSLGYTWRMYCRVAELELRPLEGAMAQTAYSGRVTFEQVAIPVGAHDPWYGVVPCIECEDTLLENIGADNDEGTVAVCSVAPVIDGSFSALLGRTCYMEETLRTHNGASVPSDQYVRGIEISNIVADMDSPISSDTNTVLVESRIKAGNNLGGYTALKIKSNQPLAGNWAPIGGPNDLWGLPFGAWTPSMVNSGIDLNVKATDVDSGRGAFNPLNWQITYVYTGVTRRTGPNGELVETAWSQVPSAGARSVTYEDYENTPMSWEVRSEGTVTAVVKWVGQGPAPKFTSLKYTARAYALSTHGGAVGINNGTDISTGFGTYDFPITVTERLETDANGEIRLAKYMSAYANSALSGGNYGGNTEALVSLEVAVDVCDMLPSVDASGVRVYYAKGHKSDGRCHPEANVTGSLDPTKRGLNCGILATKVDATGVYSADCYAYDFSSLPQDAHVVGYKYAFEGRLVPYTEPRSGAVTLTRNGVVSQSKEWTINSSEWTRVELGGKDDYWGAFSGIHVPTGNVTPTLRVSDLATMRVLFEGNHVNNGGSLFSVGYEVSGLTYATNPCAPSWGGPLNQPWDSNVEEYGIAPCNSSGAEVTQNGTVKVVFQYEGMGDAPSTVVVDITSLAEASFYGTDFNASLATALVDNGLGSPVTPLGAVARRMQGTTRMTLNVNPVTKKAEVTLTLKAEARKILTTSGGLEAFAKVSVLGEVVSSGAKQEFRNMELTVWYVPTC